MKHKLQTLLKHKLQWLILLAALLGASQGVWASTTVTAGEVIYVDASDSWFSNDEYYPRIYVESNVVGEASEYNSTKKYAITITETATGTLKLTRIKGSEEYNEFKPGDRSSGNNCITTGNGTATWSSMRQFVEGEYVYMINSTSNGVMWVSSGYYAYLYIHGFSQTYCYKFELYSGTANTNGAIYRAQIKHSGVYSNFNVCRSTDSDKDDTTSWPSNVSHQTSKISWNATKNCITGLNTYNTSDCTWSYYAPAPSSLAASVSGCSGGSGTEDSPYTIAVGDTYTITLTPSGTDSGLTYYYSFDNKSTSSTTATKSVTPGSSGTTQHSGMWVRSCAKDGSTYSGWVQSSPTSIWVTAGSACSKPTAYTFAVKSGSVLNLCSSSTYGAASTILELANSQTGYKYQLYKDNTAEGSPVDGTDNKAIEWENISSEGTYKVIGYVSGDESCSTPMDGTPTVTVYTAPSYSGITESQSVCQGSSHTIALTGASNVGTYQWKKGASNVGSNTSSYTISSVASGDEATYTCNLTNTGCTTAVVTTGSAVTYVANPDGGTATANSSAEITVESGSSATIAVSDYTEESSIAWEMSTDNGSSWTSAGQTSASFSSGSLSTTTWYRAKITKNGCDAYSSTAKVIVATRIYYKAGTACGGESGNYAGAWFALYCYNNTKSTSQWYRMYSFDKATGMYYADVTSISDWEGLIFCRMNDNKYDLSWDSRWNQTNNLTDRSTYNMWTATGCSDNKMTGSWSTYNPTGSEEPSLYIKGPLLTGAWDQYDKNAWDDVTKDGSTYTYTKTFNANTTDPGSSNQCMFSICLSTVEGLDTKLPDFNGGGKSVTLVGVDRVTGTYNNYRPTTLPSSGKEVTITVVRRSLTDFTVTYTACDQPTASGFTMSSTSVTYDGSTHSVTVSPKEGYGAVSDIKYDGSSSAPSAVGDYTVTADIAAYGDWCAVDDLEIGTFSITKRDQSTLSITTSTTTRCTGTLPLQLEVSGGTTGGNVTYTETAHTGTVSVSESGSITASTDASITVKATMAGDATYSDVESAAVTFTFTQSPVIYLTGSGAKSASTTYPWEYMTITVDRGTGKTTPNDLSVTFTETPDFSGGVAPAHSITISGAEGDKTYKIKSAKTANDSYYYTIKANGTNGGCAAAEAEYKVYINSAPAEMCGE